MEDPDSAKSLDPDPDSFGSVDLDPDSRQDKLISEVRKKSKVYGIWHKLNGNMVALVSSPSKIVF